MLNTPKALPLRTKHHLILSRETVRSLLSPVVAGNEAQEQMNTKGETCQAPPTDNNASCTCD